MVATTVPRSGFAYRPALDGVRGLAVAAVLAYHGGVRFLPGGFLGVDAFFVLSGYLITSLLLTERDSTGRIRLVAFWARRARRLLAALLVMLAAVVVAAHWLLPPGDLAAVRGDALAAVGYVANWRMIFHGTDYFAQTAAPSPLQHTWTLGIEEQFYLLWPLALLALTRRPATGRDRIVPAGRRALLVTCLAGAAVSTALCWLLYAPTDTSRSYFGTDTRAVALLVGCALAVLLSGRLGRAAAGAGPATARHGGRHRSGGTHRILGAGAVLAAVWLGWAVSHATGVSRWQYHGGFAVTAVAVAVVIAHAVRSPRSPTARILAFRPLVALGIVSYGVYLWHWPVFVFCSASATGLGGPALFAVRCAITLAVTVASYFLVERPVRRGWLRRRGSVAAPASALAAMAAVAVLAVVVTAPPAAPGPGPGRAVAVHPHTSSPAAVAAVNRPGRRPGKQPRITIFGDSVAWSLGTYLPPHPGLTVTVRAIQGCGIATLPDILELGSPHTNYPGCTRWPRRWAAGVRKDDPDVAVILLDRWELMDRRLDGRYRHVGEPGYDAYLAGKLRTAIRTVEARGARVALLTAPYTHRAERPDGGLYGEDQPARVDAWNHLLRTVAAEDRHQVSVLDLNRVTCPDGHFTWTVDDVTIRSDGLHFTPGGVHTVIAPWLLPKLATLATSAY